MSPTLALLGLLTHGERHGYDLKRSVDQDFAPFWRIDFAQLYRSLAKATRAGWVQARPAPGAGGPARKVYTLTERGRRAFEAWVTEPAQDRDEFLVKVRLAAQNGAPSADLLDARRQALEAERRARAQVQSTARDAHDAPRLLLAAAAVRETESELAALDLCEAVLPAALAAPAPLPAPLVITGSDDPLLARLAQLSHASAQSVGSLGGLFALGQHQADVAGIHLLDADTGEYNVPFVKHLLPEESILLVNLAFRENGLLLAAGNPKHIRSVRDLARPEVRFVNRQRGAGTRLLLYSRLRAARLDPHALHDWERALATHDAVAAAIATGAADAGPGLRATAAAWGLDFIPLGRERYDLAIPAAEFDSPRLHSLLDTLSSPALRRAGATLEGYDLTRTGRIVARVK